MTASKCGMFECFVHPREFVGLQKESWNNSGQFRCKHDQRHLLQERRQMQWENSQLTAFNCNVYKAVYNPRGSTTLHTTKTVSATKHSHTRSDRLGRLHDFMLQAALHGFKRMPDENNWLSRNWQRRRFWFFFALILTFFAVWSHNLPVLALFTSIWNCNNLVLCDPDCILHDCYARRAANWHHAANLCQTEEVSFVRFVSCHGQWIKIPQIRETQTRKTHVVWFWRTWHRNSDEPFHALDAHVFLLKTRFQVGASRRQVRSKLRSNPS